MRKREEEAISHNKGHVFDDFLIPLHIAISGETPNQITSVIRFYTVEHFVFVGHEKKKAISLGKPCNSDEEEDSNHFFPVLSPVLF